MTAPRFMPEQKPGVSKQDVGTPQEFLDAVTDRFAPLTVDLAAHQNNHVVARYFAPRTLSVSYHPDPKKKRNDPDALVNELVLAGALPAEAQLAVNGALLGRVETTVTVDNHDTGHIGFDSLAQDWTAAREGGIGWLNPPYSSIEPWAKKCVGQRIAFLVPAAVGSNWFARHVDKKALVLFLSPRLAFVGHAQSYPKDLILALYGEKPGYECWRWKP